MAPAFESYGGVDPATASRARAIGLVKAATLAVVHRDVVAAIGWRALVELGVAKPAYCDHFGCGPSTAPAA
jgi:hypothetical protein